MSSYLCGEAPFGSSHVRACCKVPVETVLDAGATTGAVVLFSIVEIQREIVLAEGVAVGTTKILSAAWCLAGTEDKEATQ